MKFVFGPFSGVAAHAVERHISHWAARRRGSLPMHMISREPEYTAPLVHLSHNDQVSEKFSLRPTSNNRIWITSTLEPKE